MQIPLALSRIQPQDGCKAIRLLAPADHDLAVAFYPGMSFEFGFRGDSDMKAARMAQAAQQAVSRKSLG
jgi:hypothetical protein